MKILMVISQFHPLVGGAEKQAQLLAKKLIEKGVSMTLVTGCWKFGTARKEKIDGIQVFRNFACWGMFGIKRNRAIRMVGGLIYMMSLAAYLIFHRREYDIIHVHQSLYPAFLSILIGKKFLKKPVLVKSASSGRTSDIEFLRRLPFGRFQLNYLLKKTDYLVAVSKATGTDFKEIGYPESRIVYIPNGVEIPTKGKTLYDRVINALTTARLSEEKGVDVLLRALAIVVRQEKTLKLVVIGDGPLGSELKRLAQSLGLVGSVDFMGMTRNVAQHLRSADIFVLPSRTEGLSNALLEAMSHGIPCVATNAGGNSELLGASDEKIPSQGYVIARNGLLVNPDDVKGLSEAILYVIRNQRTGEKMGRRGRKFIEENFSIDLVADKYISLYQHMMEERV
jgi:glycosyltransferase involved in cell wall biosynthesis